jgi:hypothetical protein
MANGFTVRPFCRRGTRICSPLRSRSVRRETDPPGVRRLPCGGALRSWLWFACLETKSLLSVVFRTRRGGRRWCRFRPLSRPRKKLPLPIAGLVRCACTIQSPHGYEKEGHTMGHRYAVGERVHVTSHSFNPVVYEIVRLCRKRTGSSATGSRAR